MQSIGDTHKDFCAGMKNDGTDCDPAYIEEAYTLAQVQAQAGELDQAIAILMDLLRHAPDCAVAHNDVGVLKCQTGDLAGALPYYERAVALAPDNIVFLKNLAEHYLVGLDAVKKALEIYVQILEIDSQDVETLMAAGTICENVDQMQKAIGFYETILDIEPWHVEATERIAALR